MTELGLSDGSTSTIILRSVETVSFPELVKTFDAAYQRLQEGGTLEFEILNFAVVAEYYALRMGTDAELAVMLRRLPHNFESVWDDRTVAKELLKVGFFKVWTGRVDTQPPHMLWVKALKTTPPSV